MTTMQAPPAPSQLSCAPQSRTIENLGGYRARVIFDFAGQLCQHEHIITLVPISHTDLIKPVVLKLSADRRTGTAEIGARTSHDELKFAGRDVKMDSLQFRVSVRHPAA